MEDIIYFLLFVGWLAFSFYQQSAKKKKKLEEMKAAQERQKMMTDESEYEEEYPAETRESQVFTEQRKPDFKSVLEEILLGEKLSMEDIPKQERQSPEIIAEPELRQEVEIDHRNIFQQYYDKQIASEMPGKILSQTENKQEQEENTIFSEAETLIYGDSQHIAGIDLRQAVIYSEILNRRYTN